MLPALLIAMTLGASSLDDTHVHLTPDPAAQNVTVAGIASVSAGSAVLVAGIIGYAISAAHDPFGQLLSIIWIALGASADLSSIVLFACGARRAAQDEERRLSVPRPLESVTLARVPLTTLARF